MNSDKDKLNNLLDRLENSIQKNMFIDLFFTRYVKFSPPTAQLFDIIGLWFKYRNPPVRCGDLEDDEKTALICFCLNLRQKLTDFFKHNNPEVLKLTDTQQQIMTCIWRHLFLEPFSLLNLYKIKSELPPAVSDNLYSRLLTASMYRPFDADPADIDFEQLLSTPIPHCYKAILIYWIINTPYFDGQEKHRQKLISCIPKITSALNNRPDILSPLYFLTIVQEIMTAFWRVSYIGGNNAEALSYFGDFITLNISRFCPVPPPKPRPKNLNCGQKIKIGYISRNFYKQAVSCYMVNRLIHRNKQKFEVCVFALGDCHDEMTELFVQHSDYFQRITKTTDIGSIVASITAQNLDILIYTDIGMDPITYTLAGLKLCPIQCAMVGHGTTTGMPHIQYYLSGDFEHPGAQTQYREKLIKLPRLGAAQYLPPVIPESAITRKQLNIPENAVVFVSCANGIKHGPARDCIFAEILSQVPKAWILLKPFSTRAGIDHNFAKRLKLAAQRAGAADRLIILPPVKHAKHVLGLLAIADIELDTYPYGGWTTNMEALAMGLPIVTQEGELSRSRWGAGMLRQLGITAGIAANETEYIDWAVKLAQDETLRKEISEQIKANAQKVLFNGQAAQADFEAQLIAIYNQYLDSALNEQKHHALSATNNRIVVATTLDPSCTEVQRECIASWTEAGFEIISFNTTEDITCLRPFYPAVNFVTIKSNESNIYLRDIIKYLASLEAEFYGIINPNTKLTAAKFHDVLLSCTDYPVIYGADNTAISPFDTFDRIADYIFIKRQILAYYPPDSHIGFGTPWWDFFVILVPLMYNIEVRKAVNNPVCNLATYPHTPEICLRQGLALADHFRPPFKLDRSSLDRYAKDTKTIIEKLVKPVALDIS